MNNPSLSVIVPVLNQQRSIENQIEQLLELLTELTSQFELMIVDDGSKDATHEILDDLRKKYPQVAVMHLPETLGAPAAAEFAAQRVSSDFVLTQESYDPISIEELQKLWALREDQDLVMATAVTKSKRIDSDLIQKLTEWGRRIEDAWNLATDQGSIARMYRRNAVQAAAEIDDPHRDLEISHISHRSIAPPNIHRAASQFRNRVSKDT